MENDIRLREGLLEPVLPGSTIFDERILPPLHNSYLYEESRKSFIYTSAHLINNDILQKQYATFRMEKRESGYTDEELEESFGFLLFEDESKANKLGDSGLLTGHSSCSTLGDPSKGVYVSKYSDCLDVKRWYCGKSGHIAIVRLTKGRVKEVSDNYTVNFTAPTKGFDCHESDQLIAVTATTSSFLAFERTQHYLYELINDGNDTEKCPRHVCPFAVVTFSYGKAEPSVPESSEKSEEKTVFSYQPWIGQLEVDSLVYEIGLKSSNGALLPAQLPKTLRIKTVITVSDLRMLLPKEIFETCFSGEVMVGGKCCTLYEVVSTDSDDGLLSILTEELKEKDIALVFWLGDDGFFVLLHSSYFLSYEDANSEKAEALQGMFIFSDSRTIQRDTKSCRRKSPLSSDILQVLPALNYAETEMEKSGLGHHEKIRIQLEKHLVHYATLIHPGLQSSPQREASMFPDQYDLPYVFKHLFPTPKWTEVTRSQLKSYLDQPHSFEFPVKRATEMLLAGREQRRDDPDDEVYYCISSPEEASRSPTSVWLEKPLEAEASCPTDSSEGIKSTAEKLSDSCVTTESPLESKHSDLSDLSKECNAEILNKESRPALKTSPTTLEVDLEKTEVSMEIPQAAAVVVTPEVLTPSPPKESGIVNSCDDQTAQISSAAQEVMADESTLPIPKTSAPLEASEAKFSRTEADVPLDTEIENKAPAQTDWRSLPRRRGRKRKRISKTSVSKIRMNQSLHSSSLSSSVTTEATEVQSMGAKQNQPDIEMDQSSQQKLSIEDKPVVDQIELLSSSSAPRECLENSHSQGQERVENLSFEGETPPKTAWKSLPRRCRKDQDSPTSIHQKDNKEVSEESCKETIQMHPLKRKIECLRYGLKTIITDCGRIFVPHGQEVLNKDLELVKKRQQLDGGESGLRKTELEAEKSISSESSDKACSVVVGEIANVEVAPKVLDAKEDSLSLTKEMRPASKHSKESPEESSVPTLDRQSSLCQSEQTSLTVREQHKTGNESSSETKTTVDETKSTELDKIKESGSSEAAHKKKKRNTEYTIISISQLRTVLRRGKKDSGSTAEKAKKAESDPNSKKPQGDDDKTSDDCKTNCDSVSQGQPDQANPTIPATGESECLQPNQKPQNPQSVEEENHVESSMELSKDLNKDAQVRHLSSDEYVPLPKKISTNRKKRGNPPRKWYKRKAKDITEENECFTPSPHNTEQLKPAQSQIANDILTGHKLEDLFVGSDKKRCSLEGVVNAAPMPADALTLLADLALSDNSEQNEKTLQNLGLDTEGRLNQRQGMQDSVKESSSQEAISVLHALLRRPADAPLKFPIPSRSPLPTGLVMKGEWFVVISKDHSYSQPASLLLGLSGTHPQAVHVPRTDYLITSNPVDLHGRPLNSKDDWVLLQREPCVNRNGWEQQPPIKKQLPSNTKEKQRSKRRRQIVEKDGSVEVTRVWREQYDFSLDSKFTNDPHDKAVTRALHGPWNLNIVDSPEEVHLIFHMWIGLFYSRSPSRVFHFDPIGHILQVGGNLPVEIDLNSAARLSTSNQTNTSLVSSALPAEPVVLNISDETRKTSVPSSEVLDLSVKGCEPLDLTSVNIKTRETSIEKHDPQSLDSPVSEVKSQLVSSSTDFQFRTSNLTDGSGSVRGIHGNVSYIKPSNNCASGSSDGHVKQAENVWSDVQNSSNVQRRLDGLLGPKELAHVDSSASVVQCNSSHEINTKEDTISSQVHHSSAAKSPSPKHTENTFACEKSTTVPIDYYSNASSSHQMVLKLHGHEPLKGDMNCSVEAAVSLPTDTNFLAKKTVAVNVENDSKIETIVQDQSDSEADTITTVQGQSNFRVEKGVEVDDQNNSKGGAIATELDTNSFKADSVTGQNQSDSKTETTIIMQGSQTLKKSVILDVQCPSGSKGKMVHEQNVPCTDSIMTVHDLNDVNSDAIMVVADQSDSEGEREVKTYKTKDGKVESVVTRQHQADSKIEKIAQLEHDSEPDSDPGISEQNQDRAKSETSERMKCSKGYEIQLDVSVKNQSETKPEAVIASQATKNLEVQSVIAEQIHNETKLKTTVTVQAHTDSEIKAIVDMNQNHSKPKELEEGERGNTEGETQAVEMELDDLNTDTSISEENNRYSNDASVMDLNKNSIQINRETVNSSNEYENKAPMDTQRDSNLECEIFTAGSECLADTSMEDVVKIDKRMEYEMLPEVATGKAGDYRSSHEGNVNEDLSIMEQNEQVSQSRGIVGETEKKSSTEIAEKLPHDLAEQQKTSKKVFQEAVLTSSQVAYDPCCTTKGNQLRDTENGMRCPTPTIDELPYIMGTGIAPSQGSTPTQDELPSDFGSAGGEKKCHESRSDPYDKAVYNTEGLDLAALSHMIAWFRKEQNNKRDFESVLSQNSGPFQLKLSTNSERSPKGDRTYPDSSSQLISSKELDGSSSGCIESDNQNTESYKEQCKDGPMTDQSEDLMPVSQNRCSADEQFNTMDPHTRDSESAKNLSLCALSNSVSYASIRDNTGKDRKEKQLKIYQEEDILDAESVSPAIMKAKQQERAYLKDYSNKHKHSTGSYYPQRRNPGYTDNLDQTWDWKEDEHHALHYGVNSRFFNYDHMKDSGQSSSTSSLKSSCNESFMNYRKGEGLRVTVDFKRDYTLSGHDSPIITALDDGDMQMTCKNYPRIAKHSRTNYPRIAKHSRTIQNLCHKGTQRYVEKFLHKWDALHQTNDDITQSSLDLEYLVFSEKMNHILKRNSKGQQTRNDACGSPVTIQFSSLNEQDTSEEICDALPMFSESTIKVTLADRNVKREEDPRHMPLRLQRLSCKRESEAACSNISAITAEFANSYYAMMDDVCTNKAAVRKTDRIKKQQDSPKLKMAKSVELSGKMKEDLFERLHDGLNSVVRQACKTKYRFFILVTSDDPFFRETKNLLENEGHIHVEPDQFDLETDGPATPLLIILRNEDISSHICEVPHLLELKKSSSVLFAGIDQPDDFVNLTHQELFGKGGFVVFDGTALNKLTLENMKKIVVFLEKLSKKGKWKWFLHYRDSRRFRENARSQQDVQDRKRFLDCCQDAGIVDVLPYHECDVISRDQPNYLHCLVRLQVQNATTRYPVFITDSPDKTFERNGVLTMNMSTFLQILSNDSCTIS